MARALVAMHDLRPPTRMPTYVSSVEYESGSRASWAVCCCGFVFYALRPTNIVPESTAGFFNTLLFLAGTLKNVTCCLSELLVNFREKSNGIGRFGGLEVPTDVSTGPVSIFRNRVNARLFRYNSPSFDFLIETEPVGHPLEFEPAKLANPTRFLSKVDQ